MKLEVVGEDTSSLASLRKLLTLILSGIIDVLANPSPLRSHLRNIFEVNFSSFPSETVEVSGELRDWFPGSPRLTLPPRLGTVIKFLPLSGTENSYRDVGREIHAWYTYTASWENRYFEDEYGIK